MKHRGHLLYRAILSHLFVAVPPAVLLGYLVIDANRQTLLVDAQSLNLAIAEQLRDGLTADIEAQVHVLNEADRLLSARELPMERRRILLRTLVATGRIRELGLYDVEGLLDTRVGNDGEESMLPQRLSPVTLERATVDPYAVETTESGTRWASLVLVWLDQGTKRGFVVAPYDLDRLAARAEGLRERHLGEEGRLHVVDHRLRSLASRTYERGRMLHAGTPFEGIEPGPPETAFSSLRTGMSARYVADDGNRLSAVVSAPELGWVVGASLPERVALRSIDAVRTRVMLLAIVAALLAGFVALWLARHVTEPIRQLAIAVRHRGTGASREPVDVAATAEVAVLRDAFNDALTQIERQRRDLERTTQLRLRMARFLPPTALHQLFSSESRVQTSGRDEEVALVYLDLAKNAAGADVDRARLVVVLGEIFSAACTAIELRGGRVDYFSGDAVIGIFPDDGTDFVRAAYDAAADAMKLSEAIVDRHSAHIPLDALHVSVGLAAGRTVVGRVEGENEVSVVGDLVGEVASLHGSAEPNEIKCNASALDHLRSAIREDSP